MPFTAWCRALSLSLRGSLLSCVGLRESAQTHKHFVQDLMAANSAGNTLARVEMETAAVGACESVCAKKRHARLIESLHHYSLTKHMPRAS